MARHLLYYLWDQRISYSLLKGNARDRWQTDTMDCYFVRSERYDTIEKSTGGWRYRISW